MSYFSEHFDEMGLEDLGDNCYAYTDQYSSIKYMQLQTIKDGHLIPIFSIFVKDIECEVDESDPLEGYKYIGSISDVYKFAGNDILAQTLRDAISSIGQTIFREYHILSPNLANFSNEIVIEKPTTVNDIGIIRPQINLSNSYNGTSKTQINFGFSIYEQNAIENRHSFKFNDKVISYKQVHVQGSPTLMPEMINGYVDILSNNIIHIIDENFNTLLEEDEITKIKKTIEKTGIGKTRTMVISQYLDGINKTTWNIFHALTRFSTVEKNLNVKKLLENVAETILIVPAQMTEEIERFNININTMANAA